MTCSVIIDGDDDDDNDDDDDDDDDNNSHTFRLTRRRIKKKFFMKSHQNLYVSDNKLAGVPRKRIGSMHVRFSLSTCKQ